MQYGRVQNVLRAKGNTSRCPVHIEGKRGLNVDLLGCSTQTSEPEED